MYADERDTHPTDPKEARLRYHDDAFLEPERRTA